MRSTVRGFASVGVVLLCVFMVAACKSTPIAATIPSSTPAATVAGAALATVPSGAPDYCTQLVDVPALTGLSDSLGQVANPDTQAAGQQALALASTALHGIDAGPTLNPVLANLADELDALATGDPEPGEWDGVTTALTSAGEELQTTCNFPLG